MKVSTQTGFVNSIDLYLVIRIMRSETKLTAKVACASHEAIRGKDQDCQHHLRLFSNPCCKYEKKVFVSKFLLQRKFIISSAVTGLANQQRKIQVINVEQKEWLRNSSTES